MKIPLPKKRIDTVRPVTRALNPRSAALGMSGPRLARARPSTCPNPDLVAHFPSSPRTAREREAYGGQDGRHPGVTARGRVPALRVDVREGTYPPRVPPQPRARRPRPRRTPTFLRFSRAFRALSHAHTVSVQARAPFSFLRVSIATRFRTGPSRGAPNEYSPHPFGVVSPFAHPRMARRAT